MWSSVIRPQIQFYLPNVIDSATIFINGPLGSAKISTGETLLMVVKITILIILPVFANKLLWENRRLL